MRYLEPVMFEIRVQPTVHKYLRVQLLGQPLLAKLDQVPFGQYLWLLAQSEKTRMILSNRLYTNPQGEKVRSRLYDGTGYSEVIGIGIHEFHYTRAAKLLNHIEMQMFNNYVSFHLLNSFLTGINNRPAGMAINEYIRQFTDRYDLADEDYSEKSLRKVYERHRSQPERPVRTPVVAADTRLPA